MRLLLIAAFVSGCGAPPHGAPVSVPDGSVPIAPVHPLGNPPPHPGARPSPIRAENLAPGDGGWRLSNPSTNLAAFTDHQSYRPGETIQVRAAAQTATTATWELWRLGYYGGAGGRRVQAGGPVAIPAWTPATLDPTTGAVSVSWPAAFAIPLKAHACTGVYLIKLSSAGGLETYALALVRETTPTAPILYPVAVNTYQAYNRWGGTSLYDRNRPDWPLWHAYAVSFDRPYAEGFGTGQLFDADKSFITFVESQGYDVGYATDADLDADATLATGRRLIAIQGHSEYWTFAMREHVETALAAGTHLAFFGANDCYWQARYSPGQRLLTAYKEFAAADPATSGDPQHVTTRWRDAPVARPENALIGPMFGSWVMASAPLSPVDASHWLWLGSGMTDGALVPGMYGFEIDTRYDNGDEPAGLTELAVARAEDHDGGDTRATTTIYKAPSGAWVFATATLAWSRALAVDGYVDTRIRAATANLFAVLAGDGAVPATVAPAVLPPGPAPYQYRPGVRVQTVTSALSAPGALAIAPGGDAIVVDGNRVVRISGTGALTLVAGDVTAGDVDGPAAAARFTAPRGVTVAADGTIFLSDTGNHKIKKIAAGAATTLAGSQEGYAEGTGAQARFDFPLGIVALPSGPVLVADFWNNRVRAVTPLGATTTWVGDGNRGVVDGPGARAQVYFVAALTVRADGTVVWAEAETGLIRQMAPDAAHTVSTLAGELGRIGWADGPMATAQVSELVGVAVRATGELVLLDSSAYRVRLLGGGQVVTLAGGTRRDLADGAGANAGFDEPRGVAVAADGSVLVTDAGNHALRRLVVP